jgi:hypothetical protein
MTGVLLESKLPSGVEGNRIMLAQLSVRMEYLARMSQIAKAHRKEVKQLGLRAGKTTLPWIIRRAING